MTACTYHPHAAAAGPCARCARPFCESCLVDIMGQEVCQECKAGIVSGFTERKERHPLAVMAVVVPVAGYAACGALVPITGPLGIYFGWKVLREIEEQGRYTGRSAGLAAMVIGGGTLGVWLLGLVAALALRVLR